MTAKHPPDPALDAAAAMLREQIGQCHQLSSALFDSVCNAKSGRREQEDIIKTLTRLIQASATAASALKRVKGSESRQTISVEHSGGGARGEISKTNGAA